MSLIEPVTAWVASAFMRIRMSETCCRAPSATCSTLLPWLALTWAWRSALTSALSLVPTASEAASSEARTIREPEDSLASDLDASMSLVLR